MSGPQLAGLQDDLESHSGQIIAGLNRGQSTARSVSLLVEESRRLRQAPPGAVLTARAQGRPPPSAVSRPGVDRRARRDSNSWPTRFVVRLQELRADRTGRARRALLTSNPSGIASSRKVISHVPVWLFVLGRRRGRSESTPSRPSRRRPLEGSRSVVQRRLGLFICFTNRAVS
jgi:hypothetical protein